MRASHGFFLISDPDPNLKLPDPDPEFFGTESSDPDPAKSDAFGVLVIIIIPSQEEIISFT
jgi:hypothetical protein